MEFYFKRDTRPPTIPKPVKNTLNSEFRNKLKKLFIMKGIERESVG